MGQFKTQDKLVLYHQPDGANTTMKPVSIDKNGMADKVHPNPGREVTWGTNIFGRFVPKLTYFSPPGGINTSTIEEDDTGAWSYLKKQYDYLGCFPIQERWYKCGRKDGPAWTMLYHYGQMTITQKTLGAGPSREATGINVFNSFEVSWPYTVELYQHVLSSLTIAEDQNINGIAVLSDLVVGCQNCFPGYSPDEIMYLAVNANSGSAGDYANVWYSVNGGGAFAITSTNPFATAENILFVAAFIDSDTGFTVAVVNSGTSGQFKKSSFEFGDEGTSSWSAGTNIGSAAVTAFGWLFYDRMYAASAGDIYVSTDQGDAFGTAIYTGTPQLNAFAKSPVDGSVWAVGATNTILQERNQSDTFDVLVGPTGGGTFYSLAIANDGRIYAGNGQSLYLNTNTAANAGGWSSLKDFGANKVVKVINLAGGLKSGGGDSQLVRVVVDDTTGGVGEIWEAVDGTTFVQVSALSNSGYNDAFFSSIDDNLAVIVGDGGVVQKMQSKVS